MVNPLVVGFLVLDIGPYRFPISAYCGHEIAPRTKLVADEVALLSGNVLSDPNRALAFMSYGYFKKPTTCDTACLGGIEASMRT